MRLIDADALIDFFSNIQEELGAERISFKSVNRAIDAMTTIDIVRCKECKHRYDDGWLEPRWTCDYLKDMRLKDDDFCSYGERREP